MNTSKMLMVFTRCGLTWAKARLARQGWGEKAAF